MKDPWKFVCPICKKRVVNDYNIKEVEEYVGATYDCPECGGTLRIRDDLTVEDFGQELINIFNKKISEEGS